MTDNFQSYSAPPPPPQKKSNKTVIIIAAVAVFLCLCIVACAAVIALGGASFLGISSVASEQAPIEDVLSSYMSYMAAMDIDSAYALFSPRSQRQFPSADLSGLLEGDNYLLFDGFVGLSLSEVNISAEVNADPDVPQGTVAEVSGSINYSGGYTGTIEAVLEKVDGTWRIHNVTVTIP